MAQKILMEVVVNDKGTPKVKVLGDEVKKLGKTTLDTGDVMKNVFLSKVMLDGLRLFTQAVRNSSKELIDFQDRMIKVGAISNATGKDMDFMKTQLIKMADSSEHSINALSDGMLELAKTGVKPQKAMGFLRDATNLTTAAQGNMSEVMLSMINTMKTYDMELHESTRIADVMYGVIAGTTTDIEGLTFAMAASAPVAAAMGVQYEELSAMIGLLHDQGLRGTIAGHSLKNTMLNLLSPSEEVRKMIEGMADEGFTLTEIIGELNRQGISVHEQLDTFQKRAITAVLAMGNLEGGSKEATKRITEMTKQLRNSAGVAERVAVKIRSTSWKAIGEQIKNAFLNSFEAFSRFLDEGGLSKRLLGVRDNILNLRESLLKNKETTMATANEFMDLATVAGKFLSSALKFAFENSQLLLMAFKAFLALKGYQTIVSLGKALNFFALKTMKSYTYLTNLTKGLKVAKFKMLALEKASVKSGKSMLTVLGPKGWVIAGLIAGVTLVTNAWIKHFDRIRKLNEDADLYGANKDKAVERTIKMHEAHLKMRKQFEDRRDELISSGLRGQPLQESSRILEEEYRENYKRWLNMFDEGLKKNAQSVNATTKQIQSVINFLKNRDDLGKTQHDFDPEFFRKLIKGGGGQGRGGSVRPSMDLSFSKATGMGVYDPVIPSLPTVATGGSVDPVRGAVYTPEFDIKKLESDIISMQHQMTKITDAMDLHVSQTESNLSIAFAKIKGEYDSLKAKAEETYKADPKALAKALDDLKANRESAEMVYHEHYMKVVDIAKKANREQQAVMLEGIKLTEETLQAELEFQQEWIKAIAQDTQMYWEEQREAYLQTMLTQLQIVDAIHEHSLAKMEQRHNKEMQMLTRRKNHALAMTHEDIYNRRILTQEFYRLEQKLAGDQEKEELSRKRRGKISAIIEAGINTALAVTKTLSSIGFPANIFAAAAVGALGLVQTGIIASKNYRWGGPVRGQGNATSDSVNAKLSVGENVIDAGTVDAVGGHSGVQQMIDERLDYSLGSKNDKPVVIIENFIGNKEYERGLVERLEMEAERW